MLLKALNYIHLYVAGSPQATLTDRYHLTTLKALEATDLRVFE